MNDTNLTKEEVRLKYSAKNYKTIEIVIETTTISILIIQIIYFIDLTMFLNPFIFLYLLKSFLKSLWPC